MKKAITIGVLSVISIALAVLIFISVRNNRIVYNNDNAVGNTAGITAVCSVNIMTKYILPIHTITTSCM